MKTSPTTRTGAGPKIVVEDRGHRASAPATSLAPLRFHLHRILVPVDFSPHSQNALRYALELAAQFNAEVTLVHIVEQIVYPGDWVYPPIALSDIATEKKGHIMERLKALTEGSGLKAKHIVRLGRAWQEIAEIARELDSELIVIATHGYTGLRHALLGSVAEKIVRHAPCPVLTVRANERDFV